MNWTEVFTILAIVFFLMCLCGFVACLLGRRFCRPGAWPGRGPSARGFGGCCGWPDTRDDRHPMSDRSRPRKGAGAGPRD